MQVTGFGATGRTGRFLVKELIDNNYSIKALVRSGEKLESKDRVIEIIQGDILDYNSVKESITGSEAVLSVIGHIKNTQKDMQKLGITNVIKAMNEDRITRLIVLTGAGVPSKKDKPTFADKFTTFMVKTLAKDRFEDGVKYVEEIKKSNLNWTVVRANLLTNELNHVPYKVGYLGNKGLGYRISRKNVAKFMVKLLRDNSYSNEMPYISDRGILL